MNDNHNAVVKMIIIVGLFFFVIISLSSLSGCANQQKFDYAGKKLDADTEIKKAIIAGFYGHKTREAKKKAEQEKAALSGKFSKATARQCTLPVPEGSGIRRTCKDKCSPEDLTVCSPDSECAWECPLEWDNLCINSDGSNKDYPGKPKGPQEDGGVNEETAEDPVNDIFEEEFSVTPVPDKGGSGEIINTGDNNVILNVIGSSGVVVNGGSGGHNGNSGASPVEQAMAQLLLKDVAPVKTDFQEGKEAVLDVVDKAAPWVTGAIIAKEVGSTVRATAGDHGSGNVVRTTNTTADGKSYATSSPNQSTYDYEDQSDNSTTTTTSIESGQIGNNQ